MRLCFGSPSFLVLSIFVCIASCGDSISGSVDHGVGIDMQSPGIDMQSPGIDMQSPGIDMQSPRIDMQSPGIDMQSPGIDMQSPGIDMLPPDDDGGLPASMLSLIAGGLGGLGNVNGVGVAARFASPYGVALDDANNLYVSDTDNYTIRKMNLQTGQVTTLAGTPGKNGSDDGTGAAASFREPRGLAYGKRNGKKTLYVADGINATIRAVDLETAEVTTLAGSPLVWGTNDGTGTGAGFIEPSGLTIDYDGSHLYVADSNALTIRRVDTATGAVTTIAGAPQVFGSQDCTLVAGCTASDSHFGAVEDITYGVTSGGTEILYAVDRNNVSAIRQVFIADHRVVTLTHGDTSTDFFGVVLDGDGKLYMSDINRQTISEVDRTTGALTLLAGNDSVRGSSDGTGDSASFYRPRRMVSDGVGNLYVSDAVNGTIRKVVVRGSEVGTVTTPAGTAAQIGSQDGTGDQARFNRPLGVTSDGEGNLYVADTDNGTIRKVVLSTGVVTTLAGTPGLRPPMYQNGDGTGANARFESPAGIAYVRDSAGKGHLYIADFFSRTIRQLDIDTAEVTTLAGAADTPPLSGNGDGTGDTARFDHPMGLVSDGADVLYVTDLGIRKVVISTKVVSTETVSGLNFANGVALDGQGQGHLYISDCCRPIILKMDLGTKQVTTLAGAIGAYGYVDATGPNARFYYPGALSRDNIGNLYVVEDYNHAVRRVNMAGRVTTLVGIHGVKGTFLEEPLSLNTPTAVAAISPSQTVIVDENAILLAE
jgi:sugar lactone lactonase YvrE